MHDMLVRFVDVLTPLTKLYGVPLHLLHVFYDATGGPIAFNREGSIFLNLRYFEEWREYSLPCIPLVSIALNPTMIDDQDVQKGDRQQAQTSWSVAPFPYTLFPYLFQSRFLALAHELAHNLIKQHNSEHEFWFSAICEAHIIAFSRLLRPMLE